MLFFSHAETDEKYTRLCKKAWGRHLAADAAKQYFERGCVKSIPPPSAAKGNFEQTLFPLILLRKINGNSVCSKHYLAA